MVFRTNRLIFQVMSELCGSSEPVLLTNLICPVFYNFTLSHSIGVLYHCASAHLSIVYISAAQLILLIEM